MIQFIKFLMVGVFNTAIGYAVIFSCMYLLGMTAVASNVAGYAFGLVFSYVLNRRVTFESTSESRLEIVRFVCVFLISYFSNLAVLLLLIRNLNVHEAIAQVIAGVVYVAVSFLLNKYYVFRAAK